MLTLGTHDDDGAMAVVTGRKLWRRHTAPRSTRANTSAREHRAFSFVCTVCVRGLWRKCA
jgi:hypothetical protein